MSRLPLVPEDADDPDLNPVFDYFRARGRPPPELYRTLGNAPRLLRAWTEFAWPLRLESIADRGLRELLIMRVAQLTDAETEWQAHWDMAVEHGNPPDKLAALHDWEHRDAFEPRERAALRLADEMTLDVDVSDATFAAVAERFEAGEIVELTLTVAFYSCVSRVLRALAIDQHVARPEVLAAMRP